MRSYLALPLLLLGCTLALAQYQYQAPHQQTLAQQFADVVDVVDPAEQVLKARPPKNRNQCNTKQNCCE